MQLANSWQKFSELIQLVNKMKRIILCLFSLFLFSKVWSLENFELSLSQSYEIMNGNIYEYVFADEIKNTNHLESLLNWDVNTISVFSFNVQADIFKYCHIDFNSKTACPGFSGKMQDYDWLNSDPYNPQWKNDDPCELTNYSCHENSLEKYYDISISLGYNFLFPKTNLIITPFLSYDYWLITMKGNDGYRTYKRENWEKINMTGAVISYTQEYNTFLLGIKARCEFNKTFNLDSSLMISPMMVYNVSADHHIKKSTYYLDLINNAFEIKATLNGNCRLNKYLAFGIKSSIQYIPLATGDDYNAYVNTDGKYVIDDFPVSGVQGGTSSILWTFGINWSINF